MNICRNKQALRPGPAGKSVPSPFAQALRPFGSATGVVPSPWHKQALSGVAVRACPAGREPRKSRTTGKPKPPAQTAVHPTLPTLIKTDGGTKKLWLLDGEPEAAHEAVLHHTKTGVLPDDAGVLAWMAWRAEEWDLFPTAEASMDKLQAMATAGEVTPEDFTVLLRMPAFGRKSAEMHLARAVAATDRHLVANKVMRPQQPDAVNKLLDDKLVEGQLHNVVQLPLQQIKAWSRVKGRVDSENTLAVLITAWYDHQLSNAPPAKPPTEQQCKDLSELLRLDRLSPSFLLQVLPHLKWYRPDALKAEQHPLAWHLTSLGAATEATEKTPRSPTRSQPAAEFTWSVSRVQLAQMWAQQASARRNGNLELGKVYHQGYELRMYLHLAVTMDYMQMEDCSHNLLIEEFFHLALRVDVNWPAELLNHGVGDKVPDPVALLRVDWRVGTAKGGERAVLSQPVNLLLVSVAFFQKMSVQSNPREVGKGFEELVAVLGMPKGSTDASASARSSWQALSVQSGGFEELVSALGRVKSSRSDDPDANVSVKVKLSGLV